MESRKIANAGIYEMTSYRGLVHIKYGSRIKIIECSELKPISNTTVMGERVVCSRKLKLELSSASLRVTRSGMRNVNE